MQLNNKYMCVIFGPTAAGKTDFALTLACQIGAEVINMDMGQMYTPLSIGTAKPHWQSMQTPHHLFDIISEPKNITVTDYRQMIINQFNDIWKRGNVPLLVGGSGFYLKSLLFPPRTDEIQEKNFSYEDVSDCMLWQSLHEIDPRRAAMIHPNDFYRIKRALAIWHNTGQMPSEQAPVYDPVCPILLIHVTRDRSDLYTRINARVHEMMKMGWLQEVASLKDTPWEPFLRAKKIIGYDDLLTYLDGEHTEQELQATIAAIAQKTRNYAKRQETFWRMLERKLQPVMLTNDLTAEKTVQMLSFNLTLSDINLYIEQLLENYLSKRTSI